MAEHRERRDAGDRRGAGMRQHLLGVRARAIPIARLELETCSPREHVEVPRVEIVLLAVSQACIEIATRLGVAPIVYERGTEIGVGAARVFLKAVFESDRETAFELLLAGEIAIDQFRRTEIVERMAENF